MGERDGPGSPHSDDAGASNGGAGAGSKTFFAPGDPGRFATRARAFDTAIAATVSRLREIAVAKERTAPL